nr:MAG TPA: hypothetical protein [Bacteriophage sp.]
MVILYSVERIANPLKKFQISSDGFTRISLVCLVAELFLCGYY